MPDTNDYHAFTSTSGGSGGSSSGNGCGCLGWLALGVLVYLFIHGIAEGAKAQTLLGIGFIAALLANRLFR